MSKVICEICGTSYPDTADQCPICGYARDPEAVPEEVVQEAPVQRSAPAARGSAKGGKFAAGNGRRSRPAPQRPDPAPKAAAHTDAEEDAEDIQPRQSNALLVVLLILLITALLAVTALIGVKYVLPNLGAEETTAATETVPITEPEVTEAPTVPCTSLVLTSGGTVQLEKNGQFWLLNVVILPVDSTDELIFTSSDETVATVNAEGRVTAVGEGEAVITMSCGQQKLECRIICQFPEDNTQAAETGAVEESIPDATDET